MARDVETKIMHMFYDWDNERKVMLDMQRCQRNWDLNKQIPKEDLDTIIYAIANAPSKQNLQYFNF